MWAGCVYHSAFDLFTHVTFIIHYPLCSIYLGEKLQHIHERCADDAND